MDAELKAHLNGMEDRLRGDIAERTTNMEARLREEIADARRHTTDTETQLLREFWKWARQADLRYRQYYGHVTGVDQRVGVIEERITTVEDRISEIERGRGGLA